jgi:hypothetical protein
MNREAAGCGIPIVLFGLAALGVVVWWANRGMPPGPYAADSVCTRRIGAKEASWMAFINASTNPSNKKEGETNNGAEVGRAVAEAEHVAPDEIAKLIAGMLAVNAALEKQSPPQRLFCQEAALRKAMNEPQHAFADAYFADVDKRIKADPATCRTTFADDLLQYVIRNYPCQPAQ